MAQDTKISNFSQIAKQFDIILIDRKDDLMKHLSKNNKVIVLKKKTHRPNSGSNDDAQAPTWFKSWFKEFEKKNDQRWEKQYEFNARQEQFNTQVLEFMKRQLEFNAKQEQFNAKQEQFNTKQEQFNEMLIKRLDNIVKVNNLKE